MKLPDSWVQSRFDAVCLLNPKLALDERPSDDTEVTFVPMSAVDECAGVIANPEVRAYREVAKGYTSFKQRDVLFAKVTPCMENGKAAIAGSLLNGLGFGSTEFHVLRPSYLILPEYLFHFIRQPLFREYAASAFVGTGGLQRVPTNFLARVKIPLPTVPEQQCIVDVLRQAESLSNSRSNSNNIIDTASKEYYSKLFGDVFNNSTAWPVIKLGKVSEIVRGSSPRPQGDPRLFGGPVPRLMVSDITRDGLWVNATTDSLTEEGAKSSRAMPAQSVVMAVSGAPGLTAILNHDACIHDGFVGLRDLNKKLQPEYVAYTLNLLRAKNDQQAVGAVFRNLTSDQVKAIPIPLPPIELQQQFQEFLFQVKNIQAIIACSNKLLAELLNIIRIEAFSGKLTESWRQGNLTKISKAQITRDAVMSERGTNPSLSIETQTPPERPTDFTRPARRWLIGELSELQFEVWSMLCHEWKGSVIVDDPEIFADFCTSPQTAWRMGLFKVSTSHIRRTLEQLASLGLIAKISLPKTNALTGQTEYLTAFRPLRDAENTRLADVDLLRRELGKNSE